MPVPDYDGLSQDTEAELPLSDMTIRQLQNEAAQREGVEQAKLDDAQDRADLIELIRPRSSSCVADAVHQKLQAIEEKLKRDLRDTKLRALQKRAEQRGVCSRPCFARCSQRAAHNALLEAAVDKPTLVELAYKVERPVVCPNVTEPLDYMLTNRRTGKPSWIFRGAQLSCWLLGGSLCAGTFCTPSLADALELRDPLLVGAMLPGALAAGPGMVLLLAESRRVCRCIGDQALLPQLGAGTALLTARRHANLPNVNRLFPTTCSYWLNVRTPFLTLFGLLAVTGWGVQLPWQNRCSAVIFMLFTLLASPFSTYTFLCTLDTAVHLIANKIDDIEAALERELKTKSEDMSKTQFEEDVLELVRGLIRDLELMSDGWAHGVVILTLLGFIGCGAWICCILSPALGPWVVEQSGVEWASTAVIVFFACVAALNLSLPLRILRLPAALSTECDDLREKLNSVRINNFSEPIDARLIVVERAMKNVNHGQGVGFNVAGFVINKKMLALAGAKLGVVGSSALTALLAYHAHGYHSSDERLMINQSLI